MRSFVLLTIVLGISTGCLEADHPGEREADGDSSESEEIQSDGGTSESATIQSGGGTLEWVVQAGGPLSDWGESLAVYPDGSFLISGIYGESNQPDGDRYALFAPGETNEITLTSDDSGGEGLEGFLARYSAEGELVWAESSPASVFVTADNAFPEDVCVFIDGSVLVTGEFFGEAVFGEGDAQRTLVADNGNNGAGFVATYDEGGALRFAADLPGRGVSAGCLEDGAFVISGEALSGDTFGRGEPGETVLHDDSLPEETGREMHFVARYRNDSTLSWVRGRAGFEHSNDVAGRPDGSVLWLVENELHPFTPEGEALEVRKLVPDSSSFFPPAFFMKIAASPDDAVVMTGILQLHLTMSDLIFDEGEAAETRFEYNGETAGDVDLIIAKYREDGSLIWAERAGGREEAYEQAPPYDPYGEYPYDLVVLDNASILVTGAFDGAAIFDGSDSNETVITSDGQADMFVAKYRP